MTIYTPDDVSTHLGSRAGPDHREGGLRQPRGDPDRGREEDEDLAPRHWPRRSHAH